MPHLEIGEQETRVLILREHHEVPAISPHRQDEHRADGERKKKQEGGREGAGPTGTTRQGGGGGSK